jgi:hypothetical protein
VLLQAWSGATPLQAAVLLAVRLVGSVVIPTGRDRDARNSPPRSQPKSPAAGHLRFFRQTPAVLGLFLLNRQR